MCAPKLRKHDPIAFGQYVHDWFGQKTTFLLTSPASSSLVGAYCHSSLSSFPLSARSGCWVKAGSTLVTQIPGTDKNVEHFTHRNKRVRSRIVIPTDVCGVCILQFFDFFLLNCIFSQITQNYNNNKTMFVLISKIKLKTLRSNLPRERQI